MLRKLTQGYYNKKLIDAIFSGDLDKATYSISKGANVDTYHSSIKDNPSTHNALGIAICHRDTEIILLLLKSGADVEAKNNIQPTAIYSDITALAMAVSTGYIEVIPHLLQKGADIEAKNKNGDTPLIIATRSSNLEIVELLLQNGANIEAKNNEGQNSLTIATEILNDYQKQLDEHNQCIQSLRTQLGNNFTKDLSNSLFSRQKLLTEWCHQREKVTQILQEAKIRSQNLRKDVNLFDHLLDDNYIQITINDEVLEPESRQDPIKKTINTDQLVLNHLQFINNNQNYLNLGNQAKSTDLKESQSIQNTDILVQLHQFVTQLQIEQSQFETVEVSAHSVELTSSPLLFKNNQLPILKQDDQLTSKQQEQNNVKQEVKKKRSALFN